MSEDLSDEKINSNPATKSADICKNAVLPKKGKVLEKIHHFKKFKNLHGESNPGHFGRMQASFPIYHVLTYLISSFKYDFLDYIGNQTKEKEA